MPIYTGGGRLHIQGGYNDIGRDLYNYRDNSTHNVNPPNISPPADTGSRLSTSKQKQNPRVFRARRSAPLRTPPRRKGRPTESQVDTRNEETLEEPLESRSSQYGLLEDLQLNFGGQTCENTSIEEEVILEAAYRILERRKKLADETRVQFTGNVFTPRIRTNPPSQM